MKNDKLISLVELIVLCIVSVLALVFINIDNFVRFFSGRDSATYGIFNEKLDRFLSVPMDWLSKHLLTPSVATFLLWSIIGLFCYTVIYFFIDLKKEVTEASQQGSSFEKKTRKNMQIWRSVLVLVSTVFSSIGLLVVSLQYLIPYSSTNLFLALSGHSSVWRNIQYVSMGYLAILLIPVSALVIYRISHGLRAEVTIL